VDAGGECELSGAVDSRRGGDLTGDAFDRLLAWLNEDRNLAGLKYEEIRRQLIRIFVCRGCHTPEDLADDTINRVVKKIDEVAESYRGDPAHYFYGVAQMIHLEYTRRKPEPAPVRVQVSSDQMDDEMERAYECLDRCVEKLAPEDRGLILSYYDEEMLGKLESRRALASRLGIRLNALRTRAYRIRTGLEQCIEACMNGMQRR
jgi:DNA-directed RNA polymerase specialized sigma24 family protein